MHRRELLLTAQMAKGMSLVSVRFLSPWAEGSARAQTAVEWDGEYKARGRPYLYKSGVVPSLKEGELVVVQAKDSVAVAKVEQVYDAFPDDIDFDPAMPLRFVVQRIDTTLANAMARDEKQALKRLAKAEMAHRVSELAKVTGLDLTTISLPALEGKATEEAEEAEEVIEN